MRQELDNLVRILRQREAVVSPHLSTRTWMLLPRDDTPANERDEAKGLRLCRGVHEFAASRLPVAFFAAACAANLRCSHGCVVWIGLTPRQVGHALARFGSRDRRAGESLLERSIFVMPPDDAARLWAIDLALRSVGAAMVVADGSGLGLRETRRLQLAAEARLRNSRGDGWADGKDGGNREDEGGEGGGIALLARPWAERAEPSASMTRWLIQPVPTEGRRPRWRLELARRKSSHPAIDPACWFVEWDREKGAVAVPADVAGGPGAPARGENAGGSERRWESLRLRETA